MAQNNFKEYAFYNDSAIRYYLSFSIIFNSLRARFENAENAPKNNVKHPAKEKQKNVGNIADRFKHLNIDPTKLKHGAVAPKKVVNKENNLQNAEINTSATMNKSNMNKKVQRRKKKRKKIQFDDDEVKVEQNMNKNDKNHHQQSPISNDNKMYFHVHCLHSSYCIKK